MGYIIRLQKIVTIGAFLRKKSHFFGSAARDPFQVFFSRGCSFHTIKRNNTKVGRNTAHILFYTHIKFQLKQ